MVRQLLWCLSIKDPFQERHGNYSRVTEMLGSKDGWKTCVQIILRQNLSWHQSKARKRSEKWSCVEKYRQNLKFLINSNIYAYMFGKQFIIFYFFLKTQLNNTLNTGSSWHFIHAKPWSPPPSSNVCFSPVELHYHGVSCKQTSIAEHHLFSNQN